MDGGVDEWMDKVEGWNGGWTVSWTGDRLQSTIKWNGDHTNYYRAFPSAPERMMWSSKSSTIYSTCVNEGTSAERTMSSNSKMHFSVFFFSVPGLCTQNEADSLDTFVTWNSMLLVRGVPTVTHFQGLDSFANIPSYFHIHDIKERKMMSGLVLCNQDIATFPSTINKHFKSEKAECWACVWLHVCACVFKVCQHMKAWKTPDATLVVSRINNIDQTALMC